MVSNHGIANIHSIRSPDSTHASASFGISSVRRRFVHDMLPNFTRHLSPMPRLHFVTLGIGCPSPSVAASLRLLAPSSAHFPEKIMENTFSIASPSDFRTSFSRAHDSSKLSSSASVSIESVKLLHPAKKPAQPRKPQPHVRTNQNRKQTQKRQKPPPNKTPSCATPKQTPETPRKPNPETPGNHTIIYLQKHPGNPLLPLTPTILLAEKERTKQPDYPCLRFRLKSRSLPHK